MYLITWSVSYETWVFAIWAQIAIAHVSNKTSSRDEKQTLGEYFLHPDNKKVPLIWQKISGHTSSQASQRFVYEVVVSYIFGKMRTSKVQQQLILVQWRNWRRRLYQHHDNQRNFKTLTHFWSLTRSKNCRFIKWSVIVTFVTSVTYYFGAIIYSDSDISMPVFLPNLEGEYLVKNFKTRLGLI